MARRSHVRDALYDLHRLAVLLAAVARLAFALARERAGAANRAPEWIGRHLRRAFEELGPTFVKLGQFLAMRFDILPEPLCRELEGLFESVPPVSFDRLRGELERELGAPLTARFATFDPRSIAAGAIAQVHRATLPGGRAVAVKIRRPGLERILGADLRNLRRLAAVVDGAGRLGTLSLRDIIVEFGSFTLRELDFVAEARAAERLRRQHAAGAMIPEILWSLTTRSVLTMTFLDGVSVAAASRPGQPPLERVALDHSLETLARISMTQLFVHGFFHADPHPGNVLFRPDGQVALLDFGIFGELRPDEVAVISEMIEWLARGDLERSFHAYAQLSEATADTDPAAFRRDTIDVFRRWYDASQRSDSSMRERHIGTCFGEMLTVFRRHRRRMRTDQLLFWRTLIVLDATALKLAPEFDLTASARSFFEARAGQRWRKWAANAPRSARGWSAAVTRAAAALGGCEPELLGRGVRVRSRRRASRHDLAARWLWHVAAVSLGGASGLILAACSPSVGGQVLLWGGGAALAARILMGASSARR